MSQNNEKRSVRRKSARNIKSARCSCNCDSNHNRTGEKLCMTKSPIKTPNVVKIKKTLSNNNSVEKVSLNKHQKYGLRVTNKNKLESTRPSASKNKNGSPIVLRKNTVTPSKEAEKNNESLKTHSVSNTETRDTVSSRKKQSSMDITEPKVFKKERQVRLRSAFNNVSSLKKDIKYISKEKDSNKLKFVQQPSLENKAVTKSPPGHRKSNTQPIIQGRPILICNNFKSNITHLTSKDQAKATTDSLGKSKSNENIKQCFVLLLPLSKSKLEQKYNVNKAEITNKPKPTVKMKNMLNSTEILRKNLRSTKINKKATTKVDDSAYQPDPLKNKMPIHSAVSSDQIKDKTNTKDKFIKKPLVDRTNFNKSSALNLRKRKTRNYAESSLETSRDLQKGLNENKIPVYKQLVENKMETKKQEDTYEFDSDSEQRRKKRRKRKLNKSSSDEYNKTIENILKSVAVRIKKKKKSVFPNYQNNGNLKTKLIKPSVIPTKQENIVQNKPIINVTSELKNNEIEKSITSKITVETHQPEELPKQNIEDSDGGDDNFDFGYHNAEANKENSPKIKIISDIRLLPNKELNLSVGTPRKFTEIRPNAHSTMLNNVLTPWRFNDINIIRNPHFITLKESSLPCINQEMVLDHTMVDKFEDTSRNESAKTPRRMTDKDRQNHKKMIQSIVTDFFQSYTENKENEDVESSLFDNDQFSPIKTNNQFNNKVDSVKRKILGELNDNTNKVYASTPKPNATNLWIPEINNINKNSDNSGLHSDVEDSPKKQKSNEDFTNFGFSSSDEENENQISPNKNKDDKPFRLNINVNDKKYLVNQKVKKKEKAESAVLSDAESESSEQSDVESHGGEGKLFEDITFAHNEDRFLEPQVKKKTKKKKWMDDHNTVTQKHKRRKDVRTKEEEEEAEKWAAAFNSMCKEIEEFPLEIE